jgi:hypothetical protein
VRCAHLLNNIYAGSISFQKSKRFPALSLHDHDFSAQEHTLILVWMDVKYTELHGKEKLSAMSRKN